MMRVVSGLFVTRLRGRRAGRDPLTVRAALARFAAGTVIALAIVAVGGYFALRAVSLDEARRDTGSLAEQLGQLVESNLSDSVLAGDPAAVARLDRLVVGRVLSDTVLRVKIWAGDGTIVYSDEQSLIGRRFTIGDEELDALRTGGTEVEVTDLSRPENVLDRAEGRLLEAYTGIRTASGTPVLFEIYQRFGSVDREAERLLGALALPLVGAVLLLLVTQAPLAWSMARGLQRGHRQREALLANAVSASSLERRRIASHLHDGAVQEIAGVAYGLAPIADRADRRGDAETAAAVRDAIGHLRGTVRELRALLVELHPPHLEATGLATALGDLVSPLVAVGVDVEISGAGATLDSRQRALVFRVAQEALRNVLAHARASRVEVAIVRDGPLARLVIRDDGRGFAEHDRAARRDEGHVGLSLLEELVRQASGTLTVESAPGAGTTVVLEVPEA